MDRKRSSNFPKEDSARKVSKGKNNTKSKSSSKAKLNIGLTEVKEKFSKCYQENKGFDRGTALVVPINNNLTTPV